MLDLAQCLIYSSIQASMVVVFQIFLLPAVCGAGLSKNKDSACLCKFFFSEISQFLAYLNCHSQHPEQRFPWLPYTFMKKHLL